MTGGFITSAEKLAAVRQELKKQGLDGMLLTRADRFQGEEAVSYTHLRAHET